MIDRRQNDIEEEAGFETEIDLGDDAVEFKPVFDSHRKAMLQMQHLEGYIVRFMEERSTSKWAGKYAQVVRFHISQHTPQALDVTIRPLTATTVKTGIDSRTTYEKSAADENLSILTFAALLPIPLRRAVRYKDRKTVRSAPLPPPKPPLIFTAFDKILWSVSGVIVLILLMGVAGKARWVENLAPRQPSIEELMEANGIKIGPKQRRRLYRGDNIGNLAERGIRDGYPKTNRGTRPERIDDLIDRQPAPKKYVPTKKARAEARHYSAKRRFQAAQKALSQILREKSRPEENNKPFDQDKYEKISQEWKDAFAEVQAAKKRLARFK